MKLLPDGANQPRKILGEIPLPRNNQPQSQTLRLESHRHRLRPALLARPAVRHPHSAGHPADGGRPQALRRHEYHAAGGNSADGDDQGRRGHLRLQDSHDQRHEGERGQAVKLLPGLNPSINRQESLPLVDLKLQPGQTISLQVEASDNMPAEWGGPNKSRSGSIEFHVVKPEELWADLIRRQRDLTMEVRQAIDMHVECGSKLQGAAELLGSATSRPKSAAA